MFLFFFNDTATTEIYTLSLHDALPISWRKQSSAKSSTADPSGSPAHGQADRGAGLRGSGVDAVARGTVDRKSTRLNSSHLGISYAVFCLKKKHKTATGARTSGVPWLGL